LGVVVEGNSAVGIDEEDESPPPPPQPERDKMATRTAEVPIFKERMMRLHMRVEGTFVPFELRCNATPYEDMATYQKIVILSIPFHQWYTGNILFSHSL
jgi:hypothetical protein